MFNTHRSRAGMAASPVPEADRCNRTFIRGAGLPPDVELQRVETSAGTIVLLGTCEGLTSEVQAVTEALEHHAPDHVALALEPSIIGEIEHWELAEELDREDKVYKEGLSRFGEVELPPKEYAAAVAAAAELGAQLHGVDIGESTYMAHFTEEVGIWSLFGKTWRLRRLGKKPPKAETPEAFCLAFDDRLNTGPFREMEALREERIAAQARKLARDGTVAVVLPLPRLKGVARRLTGASPRS